MLNREETIATVEGVLDGVQVVTTNLADSDVRANLLPDWWRRVPELPPERALEAALTPWRRLPDVVAGPLIKAFEDSGTVALIRTESSEWAPGYALAYVVFNLDNEPRIFVGAPPLGDRRISVLDGLPDLIARFYRNIHDGLAVDPYPDGVGPGLYPASKLRSWAEESGDARPEDLQFMGGRVDELKSILDPKRLISLWCDEGYPQYILIDLDSPGDVYDVVDGYINEQSPEDKVSALAEAMRCYLGFVRPWDDIEGAFSNM